MPPSSPSSTRGSAELAGREVRKGFAGNFGLRALEKWIAEINRGGKDGWRAQFAAGAPLAAGLRQAYAWVETNGTGGGAFRRLYADFLREGAAITGDARYDRVAALYDALAAQWTALFTSLLPGGTPLGEIRRLLHERAEGIARGDEREKLLARDTALDALVGRCEPFPGDADRVYGALAEGLGALVKGERAAVQQLAGLVGKSRGGGCTGGAVPGVSVSGQTLTLTGALTVPLPARAPCVTRASSVRRSRHVPSPPIAPNRPSDRPPPPRRLRHGGR